MNKSLELESIQFNYSALESVNSGAAVTSVLPGLVELMGAERVFLVASRTLSQTTGEFQALEDILGDHYAGLFTEIGAHTPRSDVLTALKAAADADADVVIGEDTSGAGWWVHVRNSGSRRSRTVSAALRIPAMPRT